MSDQISDLKAAGFSDDEIGQWSGQQRQQLSAAGFSDDEISQYLGGGIAAPKEPSRAWIDRIARGASLAKAIGGGVGEGAEKGWEAFGGNQPPISPDGEKFLHELGLFGDPAEGKAAPLQFLTEAAIRPLAAAYNMVNAGTGAALGAAAGGIRAAAAVAGQTPSEQERLERDVFQLGQGAMIESGFRSPSVAKPHIDPTGNLSTAHIGSVPLSEDFGHAAKVVSGPAFQTKIETSAGPVSRTEQKLLELYNQVGLHPAEVAEDASTDPVVTQQLVSRGTDLPERYVSADVSRETPDEVAPDRPSAPAPPAIPSEIQNGLASFRPDELQVDANRFQFKTGGDEAGVTERLQGVENWDPIKAGLVLVWEDTNGQRFVVDGHQRVALANRIARDDPAQNPMLNGILLREADGVSDVEARVAAAAKNIAEGTGTAVDAAKILRDQPGLVRDLPPRSALVQQARGLAQLGDEPFRMVINDVVPTNYGAIVGRLVPADEKLQGALMELLAKSEPANAIQAESIVRQGIDAGTHTETQATLFGDQDIVSSLFLDRAKILDRSLKTLARDRTIFATIVREEDILAAVGNRLETTENARRAASDSQALQILQTLANRRGELSDALSLAARGARSNGNYAAAARDFLAYLRGKAESGDLTRLADGLERGRVDAGRENAAGLVDSAVTRPRPSEERAATEQAADIIGGKTEDRPQLLLRRSFKGEEDYSVRRADGVELGVEIRATIRGGVANIVDISGPGAGYLGPRAMRSLLQQFADLHPEVTEIEGMRISGARIATGGGGNLTTVKINQEKAQQALAALPSDARPSERIATLVQATEQTDQGEQIVMPGMGRSAQQAMEAREAAGRGMIRPEAPQAAPGGMFAEPEARQPSLLEQLIESEEGALRFSRRPRPVPPPGSLEEAENSILDKLSVGQPGPKRGWTWGRLYTNTIDKLYPVNKAVADAANGIAVATPDNPYQLSRLLSGLAGKITGFIDGYDRRGNLVGGTRDWGTGLINGPSMRKVLEPVAGDLDKFRAFAAAAHGLELEALGVKTGLDTGAMQAVTRAGVGRYGPVLDQLVDYQNRVAAYLRDAGVLSRDGYDTMTQKYQLYVPFQRVIGDGDGVFRSASGSLQPSDPIHRILGSERDVVDPIESIIRNTAAFITMAEKNEVTTTLIDKILTPAGQVGRPGRTPIAQVTLVPDPALDAALATYLQAHGVQSPGGLLGLLQAASSQPAEIGTIRVFRNGTPQAYQIDPEIARAVKGLDADTISVIEKLFAPLASTLRAGAVLAPDFAARHTIRDYLYAAVTSAHGVFTPYDMARGFYALINKDERYWNWLHSGGSSISTVALDRRYLQEDIARLTQETGLMTRALNVVADPNSSWLEMGGALAGLPFKAASKYVIHPLQVLTELAENASHLGGFIKEIERMKQAGQTIGRGELQTAGFVSRDLAVDAARIGAKTRAYNMITAFANITLQDTDRVARAFVNDPIGTSFKVGAAITLPSALLWWANHDDPRYKELPEWQRDLFWIIPTDKWEDVGPAGQYGPPTPGTPYRVENGKLQVNNGVIFRVPKPWGMGVLFGSGTERLLEAFATADPAAFQHWGKSILDVMVPSLLPTAAAPIIEQWTNRNTFTNRTLIPGQMEKQLPEYQYTPYTTETAKALGKLIGGFPGIRDISTSADMPTANGVARALTSPILIENYIRGWSGNLGQYALHLADLGLRKSGLLPDPVTPTSTLADIPVVRAFIVRYPTATTQSIQDFEDRYNKNKIYYDTWLARAKEGDAVATNRIMNAGGMNIFVQLDGVQKTLNEHNQLIRDIYKDPEMAASDKRQLIDTLYYRMIEIGQSGKAALHQVDASLTGAGG